MAEPKEFLRISDLHAWYGESHILHGVNLTVNEGEVVTLLGRNGAGRTTTIKMVRLAPTFLMSWVTRSTSSWPMPWVGSSSSISSGSMAKVVAISSARLRP